MWMTTLFNAIFHVSKMTFFILYAMWFGSLPKDFGKHSRHGPTLFPRQREGPTLIFYLQ